MLQAFRDILISRDNNILASTFTRAVDGHSHCALIINDDCRLASKPCLDSLGFRYVWVDGQHTFRRPDSRLPRASDSSHDALVPRESCQWTLTNESIDALSRSVAALLREFEVIQ